MAFSNTARICCSFAVWALSGTSSRTALSFSFQATTRAPIHRSFSQSALKMSEQQTEVDIQTNLDEVKSRIELACKEIGRPSEEVRLVAVSKTKPLELLKQA